MRRELGRYLALNALRIAVIDDSAYFRKLVRTILQAYGVRQIYESPTTADGFDVIRFQKPDVVLLDWNLGTGGNGADLLTQIRCHADEQIATQAVVLLSAYSDKRHVLDAMHLGANDFIVKPVAARVLYDHLAQLSSQQQVYKRRGNRLVPVIQLGRRSAPGPAAPEEVTQPGKPQASVAFL